MPRAQVLQWGIALGMVCALAVWPSGAFGAMPPVDAPRLQTKDPLPPLSERKLGEDGVRHALSLDFSNGGVRGQALTWLQNRLAHAAIFAVGDEPGMVEGVTLLEALLPAFDRAGYRAYALEVGPWMAANIEDITRRGGGEIERYLRDEANARQMQVINFTDEAGFAQKTIQYWSDWPRVLWGLDQEFLTSAPFLLERLSLFAVSPQQHNAITLYRMEAEKDPFYLAHAPDHVFDHLKSLFPKQAEEPHALIKEMALSKHIYGPFLENSAKMQQAFERREALLWDNFLRFWRETVDRMKAAPRVLVKTSTAHMHAEVAPTGVPSFGKSLRDFAKSRKRPVYSIAVVCGPGGAIRRSNGGVKSCDAGFDEKYAALRPYLPNDGKAVVIPRSVLGDKLTGFDAYVVIPNATPATPAWEEDQAQVK